MDYFSNDFTNRDYYLGEYECDDRHVEMLFSRLKERNDPNIDKLIEAIKEDERFKAFNPQQKFDFITSAVELYDSIAQNQEQTNNYIEKKEVLNAVVPYEDRDNALFEINKNLPNNSPLILRSTLMLTEQERRIKESNSLVKVENGGELVLADNSSKELALANDNIIDIEVEPNREPKEPNKSESTEPKESAKAQSHGWQRGDFDFNRMWNYVNNNNEYMYPFSQKETDFSSREFGKAFVEEATKFDIGELREMVAMMRAKNEMLFNKNKNLDEYTTLANELFAETKKNQELSREHGAEITNEPKVEIKESEGEQMNSIKRQRR